MVGAATSYVLKFGRNTTGRLGERDRSTVLSTLGTTVGGAGGWKLPVECAVLSCYGFLTSYEVSRRHHDAMLTHAQLPMTS